MALMPLLVVALTRRWEVVRWRLFWLPAVVVTVMAGPWTVFTIHTSRKTWNYGHHAWPDAEDSLIAIPTQNR